MPERDDSADLGELARAVRELSARVQRLEQRLEDIEADRFDERPSRSRGPIPISVSRSAPSTLESRIGSEWLNRIGVVAVLFGVGYLLRYIFVNQWISAAAWIWLGVGCGAAVIAGSEWFRRRGYRVLSLSLKATGVGVSYLSFWAARELYNVLSGPETFAALVVLTVVGAALALRESSEVLAALALIGGFLTPVLIAMPTNQVRLLLYLFLLDCAAATLAGKRAWWKLVPLAFAGTVALSSISYFEHSNANAVTALVIAATAYFAIFCASAAWFRRRVLPANTRSLLGWFEIVNAGTYFLALWLLLSQRHNDALVVPALALAALYFLLASRAAGREAAVYGGLGIGFVAAALAVVLETDWLSLGWFLEAAVVIGIGFWKDLPWLRWGALLLLTAAVIKAFAFDIWQLSLGYRTLSFVALGVLLLVISFAYQRYGLATILRARKGPSDQSR